MRRWLPPVLAFAALLAAFYLALRRFPAPAPPTPPPAAGPAIRPALDNLVRLANKGVALLEQHEFSKSESVWREVVSLAPDWTTAKVNLGIALLNQPSEERYPEVERTLREALARDPKNPHAHYSLAMLYDHLGRDAEAASELEAVLVIDPDDADTHYALGRVLQRLGRTKEAVERFERATALAPSLASAWYGLALALRTESPERSMQAMSRFQELERAGVGVRRGLKYTEMGKYADAIRLFDLPLAAPPANPIRFVDASAEFGFTRPHAVADPDARDRFSFEDSLPSAATFLGSGAFSGDLDGDGDVDLAIGDCGMTRGVRLYRNDGGKFADATEGSGLEGDFHAMGVYGGDFDNDGDLDLFVTGRNRFFVNEGGGRFRDATEAMGLAVENRWSLGAAWVDIDQDGDLDLFVGNYSHLQKRRAVTHVFAFEGASNALYLNKSGEGFEDVADKAGVGGGEKKTTGVLAADLDGDGDPDLLALHEDAPPTLYWNDRVLRFREAPALTQAPATTAFAGDFDGDADLDLFLGRRQPVRSDLFRQTGRGVFTLEPTVGTLAASTGAFLDLDNDGDLDLVTARKGAVALYRNDGGSFFETGSVEAGETRSLAWGDFDGDGDLDLVVVRAGAPPLLLKNEGGNRLHHLAVRLKGIRSGGEMRSPAQGIGAWVEVKAGGIVLGQSLGGGGGWLGGESDALHFGLGPHGKADFVRIVWPDGVLQAEVEVAAGQTVTIEETQRKASSCPVIFAWDGESFRFETDFLGVGGLGFLVEPGVYGPPDPDEVVRLETALEPRDGFLELRIAELLEEVTYADRFALLVADHPEGTEVFADERFAANEPWPTGEIFAVHESLDPVAARDDRGNDRLAEVLAVDRRYAGPAELDPRFLGYARDWALEVEFDDRAAALAADGRRVFLLLHGWTEYPYSRINLAAFQCGVRLTPASLEVRDGEEGWRTAIREWGYPAGLPRWSALEVTAWVRAGQERFRLPTNMEVYWDRIALAAAEPQPPRVATLLPASAELRFLGYPREYSPDGRSPRLYDYGIRDLAYPLFRSQSGAYTRFGEVVELLRELDDRFVIFGKGEELALRFDASALHPLPPGWRRTFFLLAEGYCKDRDPCTAEGETVGPLPFRSMSSYPPPPGEAFPDDETRRRWREEWNARKVPPTARW